MREHPTRGGATGTGAATLSRRRLLTEGAVAGGLAVASASCGIGDPDPLSPRNGAIEVPRVDQVPALDARSRTWQYGYPMAIEMDGQMMANPQRPTPAVPEITVRAIHDGSVIGFRLEWECEDERTSTVEPTWFRDAAAVLLAPGAGVEDLRPMGTADQPATLLHWKADWQRQVDGDMQGVPEAFPNTSADYYPPLVGVAPDAVNAQSYVDAGATEWLPGLRSDNPMSAAGRSTPVEKLTARRFGTLTTCATQDATGQGVHADGRWIATLVKPLSSSDPDEVALTTGGSFTCAFAVWVGATADSGGKKSPSKTAHLLTLGA